MRCRNTSRRTTASSAEFMSRAPMPGAPEIMPSFDRRFTPLAPIGPSWPVDDTMTLHSSTCVSRTSQTVNATTISSVVCQARAATGAIHRQSSQPDRRGGLLCVGAWTSSGHVAEIRGRRYDDSEVRGSCKLCGNWRKERTLGSMHICLQRKSLGGQDKVERTTCAGRGCCEKSKALADSRSSHNALPTMHYLLAQQGSVRIGCLSIMPRRMCGARVVVQGHQGPVGDGATDIAALHRVLAHDQILHSRRVEELHVRCLQSTAGVWYSTPRRVDIDRHCDDG